MGSEDTQRPSKDSSGRQPQPLPPFLPKHSNMQQSEAGPEYGLVRAMRPTVLGVASAERQIGKCSST